MCPMCMMRAALLAVAAVSTGGMATYLVAKVSARERGKCEKCHDKKEHS
ncbi:MAG TPA: hypothetical protein VN852_10700 [Candidatus Krumholzibacteria bacterium]|nr:hypothetical protein [Candidatus Krumholzibacteria bacterium]